ncbi:MAG: PIG-L family deacetylase [Planctomycetaceae bacterium]|nr:PIG-L family deacetylase [Planctomycetaceae bacterium]
MSRILVVAPHCDDETLGMGGTIARLAGEGHELFVAVMTGHGKEQHPIWERSVWDIVRAESQEAMKVLGVRELLFSEVPAALVASVSPIELNKEAHDILSKTRPDELYIPFSWDLHKDHREISHSFQVACRPHTELGRKVQRIWMYETVSETHWNFASGVEPGFIPNTWVDISATLPLKVEAMSCYKSQLRAFPDARSLETLEALAKWRGSQVGMRAAEGFLLVRALLGH